MRESILLSLRLARRSFRREPAVVVTAALTLALGLGASTTIFSIVHGFKRPLPVPGGEAVVQVRLGAPGAGGEMAALEPERAQLLIEDQTLLESLGAFAVREVTFSGGDLPPVRLPAAAVTDDAFDCLRLEPQLGRLPGGEGASGEEVVLGHRLWQTAFGGDRSVVGRTVRLDDRPVTVAGVMPAGFAFPFGQQLWIPLDLAAGAGPSGPGSAVELVGRLAEGVPAESVAAELAAILNRSDTDDPDAAARVRVRVLGFTRARAEGGEEIALLALLIIVFALMLLACTNVSNLLLARAQGRVRELALHGALGARPRFLRLQMFAEAALIALTGAGAGLLLAAGAIGYVEGTLAANWGFYWMQVSLDVPVVIFLALAMVVTALVSGTLPARQAAGSDPGAILSGVRVSGGRRGRNRIGRTLLGLQVTFSVIALITSGFVTSGLTLRRQAVLSFEPDRIVMAGIVIEGERYRTAAARRELRNRLPALVSDRTGGAPAALMTGLPGFQAPIGRFEIEGRPAGPQTEREAVMVNALSPGAFTILGLDPQAGRTLVAGDGLTDPVVVISEGFRARHLSGVDPLQVRLRVTGVAGAGEWMRIVGIVPDEVQGLSENARLNLVYIPIEQADPDRVFLALASDETPAALAPRLRDALRQADPRLPLYSAFLDSPVFGAEEMLAYAGRFFETTGLLALLGSLGGLVVALVGIYGALAFHVRQRTREMRIRLAVGAGRRRIVREIIGRGWRWIAPGLVAGLIIAWLVSPIFGVFLGGIEPHAPGMYLGAVGLYLLISLVALLPPALRAAAVDPARIIREE